MVVHDLLLSLVGFTGDIVEVSIDGPRLELNKKLHLETFDRDIVEGIIALGSMYISLREFVDHAERSVTSSLYELGLAKAIDEKILNLYEVDVAKMEKEVLTLGIEENLSLSLSAIRLDLWDKYFQGFQLLVDEVVVSTSRDDLIDHVIGLSETIRHPFLDIVIEALIGCLVKEIEAWCKFCVVLGNRFRSKNFILSNEGSVEASALNATLSQYQIDRLRIPSRLVSLDTVDKILFTGRAVGVIQNGNRSKVVVPPACNFFSKPSPAQYHLAAEYIAQEVDRTRLYVSSILCSMIQPNLQKSLSVIRGVFLMGFSNNWVSFIEESSSSNRKYDDIFQVSFNMIHPLIVRMNEDRDLELDLPWPMELIVSPAAVDRYSKIFKALYRMTSASVRARYSYNMQINSLFASLQSYMQVDVIESAFMVLMKTVKDSNDIQTISVAHDEFLSEVNLGCLVDLNSVWDQLDRLFQLCDDLSRNRHLGEIVDNQVRAETQLLLQTLENLQERSSHRIVQKLLLKLNFNQFYDQGNSER